MTPAQRAAAQISEYLLTGMHHTTAEARRVMADIIAVAILQEWREPLPASAYPKDEAGFYTR